MLRGTAPIHQTSPSDASASPSDASVPGGEAPVMADDDNTPFSREEETPTGTLLSVVVPCYNEEAIIPETHRRLVATLENVPALDFELIYVDDGSRDATLDLLRGLQRADSRVRVIALSRNFGQQVAITAGLAEAAGDAVTLIDADLQDPPEIISEMLERWRRGADVAYGVRSEREGETTFKRLDIQGILQAHGPHRGHLHPARRRRFPADGPQGGGTRSSPCRNATASCAAWWPGSAFARNPFTITGRPGPRARPNGRSWRWCTWPWTASCLSPSCLCAWRHGQVFSPPGWLCWASSMPSSSVSLRCVAHRLDGDLHHHPVSRRRAARARRCSRRISGAYLWRGETASALSGQRNGSGSHPPIGSCPRAAGRLGKSRRMSRAGVRWLKLSLGLAITAGFVWLLARGLDLDALGRAFAGLSAPPSFSPWSS